MRETTYEVNLLFRNGPLQGAVAKITTKSEAGEVINVPHQGKVHQYRLLDGPALQAAMQDGKAHEHLAAAAEWIMPKEWNA